jgi:hypothetical protein
MKHRLDRLLGSTALSTIWGTAFAALALGPAYGADFPTKASPSSGCTQAVDGANGKLAGLGGTYDKNSLYGAMGSLAVPLGCQFGAQLDGTAASLDDRFLGSLGGHLFWRNPAEGLIGLYGSYTNWNQVGGVHASHTGVEAEWYSGRLTLQGVAGVETGNTASGTVGGLPTTFNVKTRFFDQINLDYYAQDNFKVYLGHRYLAGQNALALGGEYGVPLGRGIMAAPFVEGRVGENNFRGVWGGLRFYFGQKDKTLIRRQREDDPIDWGGDFGGLAHSGSASSSSPASPPPPSPPPPPPPPPLLSPPPPPPPLSPS